MAPSSVNRNFLKQHPSEHPWSAARARKKRTRSYVELPTLWWLVNPIESTCPVGPACSEVKELLDGTPALSWHPHPYDCEGLVLGRCRWCWDAGTVIHASRGDVHLVSLGVAWMGDRSDVVLEGKGSC